MAEPEAATRPNGDEDSPTAAQPQLFPVDIPLYDDAGLQDISAETAAEIDAVARLLSEFGFRLSPWQGTGIEHRDEGRVRARIEAWQALRGPSLLYWLGHGWSDGERAALACKNSPKAVRENGITPSRLADAIFDRESASTWCVVLIEACKSSQFVKRVAAELSEPRRSVRQVWLLGTSNEGSVNLGKFRRALSGAVLDVPPEDQVSVGMLAQAISDRLEDGEFRPINPSASAVVHRIVSISVGETLEARSVVQDALSPLPRPEQAELVDAARGVELGDALSHFVGRDRERERLAAWLRGEREGMLVLTGPPGSGKSALLGNIFANAWPQLRARLAAEAPTALLPASARPPDHAFAASVNLRGATAGDAVEALGEALSWEPPAPEVTGEARWDVLMRAARAAQKTVLLDGLDEAQQPFDIARRLRDVASTTTRLVVGTRASTREGPDEPAPGDEELLHALAEPHAADRVEIVRLEQEPDAVAELVRRRLASVSAEAANATAEAVRRALPGSAKGFLFGSLLITELLARPELLGDADAVRELAESDHWALFELAVQRLAADSIQRAAVLEALAFALGRGMPTRDATLAHVATALADSTVELHDVDALLEDASPYVVLDGERGQSVYRLAHKAFQEHYLASRAGVLGERHGRIVDGLLAVVDACATDAPLNAYVVHHLPGHAERAGRAAWQELAARKDVLDLLDPRALAADAFAAWSADAPLPEEIVGVIDAHHLMVQSGPGDRAGLRQLGVARTSGRQPSGDDLPDRPAPRWTVLSAAVEQRPVHLTLEAGAGIVALTSVQGADGPLLAAACADGALRLWNAETGELFGEPIRSDGARLTCITRIAGHTPRLATGDDRGNVCTWDPLTGERKAAFLYPGSVPVRSIASYPDSDGPVLLAAGGDGSTRAFPASGAGVPGGEPIAPRDAGIQIVAAADDEAAPRVTTGSADGMVRIWNPRDPAEEARALTGHTDWITAATAWTRDAVTWVAAASYDKKVLLWHGPQWLREEITDSRALVRALSAYSDADGTRLVTGDDDGVVHLWDAANRTRVGHDLKGHDGAVCALTTFEVEAGTRIASADDRGRVMIWNPASTLVGTGTSDVGVPVRAVVTYGQGDRREIATASDSSVLQLWHPESDGPLGSQETPHRPSVRFLATYTTVDGVERIATSGSGQTVRLWERRRDETGSPLHEVATLEGHTAPVRALAHIAHAGRDVVATGGEDGVVLRWSASELEEPKRLHEVPAGWVRGLAAAQLPKVVVLAVAGQGRELQLLDMLSGADRGTLDGHEDWVMTVCAVPAHGGEMRFASAGDDCTIRLWNAAYGAPVGKLLTGHTAPVRALVPLVRAGSAHLASGSEDGTVRIWDPEVGETHCVRLGCVVHALAVTANDVVAGTDDGHVVIDIR
ncbi:MAG: AAA family ATPase [Gaiellaceae bacterium]